MAPVENFGRKWLLGLVVGVLLAAGSVGDADANPAIWQFEWPNTDFTRASVSFDTVVSGFGNQAVGRDRIPAIDNPSFGTIAEAAQFMAPSEPVITVEHRGVAKAYPLSIMIWHEIVNDEIAGLPIAVTFCPLCNSSIVFSRIVNGRRLDFGVTGKLINSDLIMFDRQTESWWQQFTGEGIVGEMTGTVLEIIPVRVESFERFRQRFPRGAVMRIPLEFARNYGSNPYTGYDSYDRPPLLPNAAAGGLPPLSYVVAVGEQAWSLDLLRARGRITTQDGLIIEWSPGQNSVLDAARIAQGRDIGNVTVQRRQGDRLVEVAHDTTFAFAFMAFSPQGILHVR